MFITAPQISLLSFYSQDMYWIKFLAFSFILLLEADAQPIELSPLVVDGDNGCSSSDTLDSVQDSINEAILQLIQDSPCGLGWRQVVTLDFRDPNSSCPSSLIEHNDSGIRTCGIDFNSSGCSSVTFPVTSGYSKVCGKIIGYQVGSTDAFNNIERTNPTIDTFYVDGVSLTHGNPRQHIWTFASAIDEVTGHPPSNCPCTHTPTASQAATPPEYVGNDYFCDTGSSGSQQPIFYVDDPLWDGAGCGDLNTCCSFNNPPWFYKQLPQHTTDDIEMRLCTDQGGDDEGMVVEMVDIYIR